MKIAVTGGTGFVGSGLVEVLLNRGDAVLVVTRSLSSLPVPFRGLVDVVTWEELDLSGIDGVVHLAGENLFQRRWGSAQKRKIRESRVAGTKRLVEALARAELLPRVLVSGSAVGYYGPDRGDTELSESAPPAEDYLARVCRDWEQAAAEARDRGCRVVPVRIGVVLGPAGGALARMVPPFRMYVGGPVGSGKQWVSWIHRKDLARLIVFALEHESLNEPLNGTAPQPIRMAEFCKSLGRSLRRPSWLPAPGFALRLTLGEVADVILTGQRVVPSKVQELGFEFEFSTLEQALDDILLEEVVP